MAWLPSSLALQYTRFGRRPARAAYRFVLQRRRARTDHMVSDHPFAQRPPKPLQHNFLWTGYACCVILSTMPARNGRRAYGGRGDHREAMPFGRDAAALIVVVALLAGCPARTSKNAAEPETTPLAGEHRRERNDKEQAP